MFVWSKIRAERNYPFLPVQIFFVPAVPKCDVFREGCDKKRHELKKMFSCARASHSSQKWDTCDASHFLSPEGGQLVGEGVPLMVAP